MEVHNRQTAASPPSHGAQHTARPTPRTAHHRKRRVAVPTLHTPHAPPSLARTQHKQEQVSSTSSSSEQDLPRQQPQDQAKKFINGFEQVSSSCDKRWEGHAPTHSAWHRSQAANMAHQNSRSIWQPMRTGLAEGEKNFYAAFDAARRADRGNVLLTHSKKSRLVTRLVTSRRLVMQVLKKCVFSG